MNNERTTPMKHVTLDQALTDFLTFLRARNTSALRQEAYQTDIQQFLDWLQETTVVELSVGAVTKTDIIEYLSHLADRGVIRARKLASLHEFFKYLVDHDAIASSPAASIAIPKKVQQ